MNNHTLSQQEAQLRVDRIEAFNQELQILDTAGILDLSSEQQARLRTYQNDLLADLQQEFDVDVSHRSKQLSLGMKVASLFGALAMAASLFFMFYQFWGHLKTVWQVGILIAVPLMMLGVVNYCSNKEQQGYFAKIAALLCFVSFVLNISMLGQIFNISPSPNAFAIWAVLGFTLAYACNARLLVFFAILSACSFIAMRLGAWNGMYWIHFGERPENFFLPSLLCFFIPSLINHKRYMGFDRIYRVCAMIMIFLSILILSFVGKLSYFEASPDLIEGSYQLAGMGLAAITIWLAIRQKWSEVLHTGNTFFVLFLYTKMFDWWWDWMPKYVFFFVLGLTALLLLLVFKRLRMDGHRQEVAE